MSQPGQAGWLQGGAAQPEPTMAELLDPAALQARLAEARVRRAEAIARRDAATSGLADSELPVAHAASTEPPRDAVVFHDRRAPAGPQAPHPDRPRATIAVSTPRPDRPRATIAVSTPERPRATIAVSGVRREKRSWPGAARFARHLTLLGGIAAGVAVAIAALVLAPPSLHEWATGNVAPSPVPPIVQPQSPLAGLAPADGSAAPTAQPEAAPPTQAVPGALAAAGAREAVPAIPALSAAGLAERLSPPGSEPRLAETPAALAAPPDAGAALAESTMAVDAATPAAPARLATLSSDAPPSLDAAPPSVPVAVTVPARHALPPAVAALPEPSFRSWDPPAATPAAPAARPAAERPPALTAAPIRLRPALRFAGAAPTDRPRAALSLPAGNAPRPDAVGYALAAPPETAAPPTKPAKAAPVRVARTQAPAVRQARRAATARQVERILLQRTVEDMLRDQLRRF